MRKFILVAAVAVAALSLGACTTYTEYARTLPQYQPHDPNRCYSNVSVGSLTPSDPQAGTTILTGSNGKPCPPAADDTMAKMRSEVGAGNF